MLTGQQVRKELESFRKYVVSQARANLTRLKKNSSKTLYDSIKGDIKYKKGDYTVEIEMENYGLFVDKGVSGVNKKYGTPYSYKSKGGKQGLKGMPPPSKLDKWIVRKGIAPRDKNGRLISRKSLQFLIARGIFKNGIAPSLFFTKPFRVAMDKLPTEVYEAYGIDIDAWMSATVKKFDR